MIEPEDELYEEEHDAEEAAELRATVDATRLLKSPHFFNNFLADIRRAGLVGEERNAAAQYVIYTSRFRDKPLSALVKGSGSGGKDFFVQKTLEFIPEGEIKALSSISDETLYDMSDLDHEIVYFYGPNGPARYRLLQSEQRIACIKKIKGKWSAIRDDVTRAKAVFISTTSQPKLAAEYENVHLSLWIDETAEQTRRIVEAYTSVPEDPWTIEDTHCWHKVQELLAERQDLPIKTAPWFAKLAAFIPSGDVRIRRYWPAYVEACKTVCLIRSFSQRLGELEDQGWITVSFEDFAITNLIFDRIIAETLYQSAGDEALKTAAFIEEILKKQENPESGVDAEQLSKHPRVAKKAKAYRLLATAEHAGTIYRSNADEKNNRKAYLPVPKSSFLGSPKAIFNKLQLAPVRFVHPFTGKWVAYGPEPLPNK